MEQSSSPSIVSSFGEAKPTETAFVESKFDEIDNMISDIELESEGCGDMRKLWEHRLQANEDTDSIVTIGDHEFECHSILLKMYSKHFANYGECAKFELSPDEVSPLGFSMAYEWMRFPDYTIDSEFLVELLQAARWLEMDELEEHCFSILNLDNFIDNIAYHTFRKASPYRLLHKARLLLLSRIGSYFLTLVGSNIFKDLSIEELTTVISSNTCAVNTECEVFFAILYWINLNPEPRLAYLVELMDLVRFGYLPIQFLSELESCFNIEDQTGFAANNHALKKFITISSLKNLCRMGLTFTVLRSQYHNMQELEKVCAQHNIELWEPRAWIYDEICPYHIAENNFPCPHDVSFDAFLDYVEVLQGKPHEHIENFKSNMSKTLQSEDTRNAEDIETSQLSDNEIEETPSVITLLVNTAKD